jgi:hypothetical protein
MLRIVTVVMLATAACAEPDHVIELGVIEFLNDPLMVEVPSDASIGAPIIVSVITYGGGCHAMERTDIELTSNGADVFPFDRRIVPNGACTQPLLFFSHDVTVSFDTPGSKDIRFHGRRMELDGNGEVYENIQRTRSVVVE